MNLESTETKWRDEVRSSITASLKRWMADLTFGMSTPPTCLKMVAAEVGATTAAPIRVAAARRKKVP
jgi:hypothetical protein